MPRVRGKRLEERRLVCPCERAGSRGRLNTSRGARHQCGVVVTPRYVYASARRSKQTAMVSVFLKANSEVKAWLIGDPADQDRMIVRGSRVLGDVEAAESPRVRWRQPED
jgi:hypothetical protein